MSDKDQNTPRNPQRENAKTIAFIFLIVLIGMLVFEAVYHYIHPHLFLWEKHLLTLLFSTLFACAAAFFALRKHQLLEKSLIQEIDEHRQVERDLRQSETRYRHLVEDQTEFIARWKPDGTRTFVNQAYCRFFNQTPSQLIGANAMALVHEDDREALREKIDRLSPVQSVCEEEHRAYGPDGHVYWIAWTHRGVFDDRGQLSEGLSVGRDITERKLSEERERVRTEQLISHQCALLELTKMDFSNFEAALQNILEMDSRTLKVDRVSLWLFNEDHSEIMCKALYKGKEDIHEKGNARRTRHSAHYFEALENSRVLAVAHAQGDPRTDELNDDYLRPLGIQSLMDLPVRLNGTLIGVVFHEHTDQPREWNVDEQDFAASIADAISLAFAAAERQRADEALRAAYDELEERVEDRTAQLSKLNVLLKQEYAQRERAETQLTDTLAEVQKSRDDMIAVLDQLHSGTVMTDEDGRVTFVSEAAQHLLHQGSEKVLGRPWMEWFPFQEQDKVELQAIAALPPEQRRKLSVQVGPPPGGHTLGVDLEIQVNDDPRNQQRKIVFLYDQSEVHNLRRLLEDKIQFHDLVGKSKAMVLVYHQIRQVAKVDTTVLIEGETGTGKELVARAIHFSSHRKDAPFIAVNCAGLTESLLGSQLFGHKRGAFTGAVSDHQGVFEAANGGTLFLDEIGDIPLTVQTSLLRVLQEREVTPLGESKPRKVDARVLVATNRNLVEAVDSGQFRADLLYRIRIARIHLPPLRNRQEDIPLLSGTFLKLARSMTQKDVDSFSPAAMRSLLDYYWPGNVRELRSAIESAVIQCEGTNIEASDLPPEIATDHRPSPGIEGDSDDKGTILSALDRAQGNRSEAARLLGISRATLFRRLSHHGLSRPK